MSVASQPGHGTIFKKTFPRAEGTAPSVFIYRNSGVTLARGLKQLCSPKTTSSFAANLTCIV